MSNNTFKIGDSVIATPLHDDNWHEFEGTVISVIEIGGHTTYTVEDQDGDCFDTEENQLQFIQ